MREDARDLFEESDEALLEVSEGVENLESGGRLLSGHEALVKVTQVPDLRRN